MDPNLTDEQLDLLAAELARQADERLLDPASTDTPDFEVNHVEAD
jgi:hypothetical protein